MITPEELAEVERFGGAMPGPWRAYCGGVRPVTDTREERDQLDPIVVCYGDNADTYPLAEFIARARTLLPRLAAAHEELLAKHGALFDAASKLTIAVRSGRGVTEALAALELVLDPEGEEVTGG